MAAIGKERNACKVLVARADGKRQLGSPSGRHEDAGNF
jgi:hypothetical protein